MASEYIDVPELLDEFSKRPGCDRYRTDSNKIELLTLYLSVRQFAPDLEFDTFLSRLEPVAGYDEENGLLPADALSLFCPRSKSRAEQLQRTQWSAVQVVDLLAYYVDGLRAGQFANVSARQYLEKGSDLYLAGAFGRIAAGPSTGGKPVGDKPPAKPKTGGKAAAPVTPAGVPAVVGQAAILTLPTGRQFQCVVQNRYAAEVHGQEEVNVLTRDGELVFGLPLAAVEYDPAAVADETVRYSVTECPMPVEQAVGWQRLLMAKYPSQHPESGDVFNAATPAAGLSTADDDYICQLSEQLLVRLSLRDSSTGPYVLAELKDLSGGPEAVLQVLPPREMSVYGEYKFKAPGEDHYRVLVVLGATQRLDCVTGAT